MLEMVFKRVKWFSKNYKRSTTNQYSSNNNIKYKVCYIVFKLVCVYYGLFGCVQLLTQGI